jgi:hypothetical protein
MVWYSLMNGLIVGFCRSRFRLSSSEIWVFPTRPAKARDAPDCSGRGNARGSKGWVVQVTDICNIELGVPFCCKTRICPSCVVGLATVPCSASRVYAAGRKPQPMNRSRGS